MNKKDLEKNKRLINDLNIQLENQKKIRDQVDERIQELNKLIFEKEKELRIYDYYSAVRVFLESANNVENHNMNYKTQTRDLMTNLKRGHYTEDEHKWKNGKYVLTGKKESRVDYYIINYRYILIYSGRLAISFNPPIADSFTASEFKKYGGINSSYLKSNSEDMKVKLKNGRTMTIYNNPIELCGQTYDDMDYRKEWSNGYLEYEGNNYGDTSSFYFVGEII